MTIVFLNQSTTNDGLKNIRFVATDMDGTLTQQGKFTASLLQSLEDLAAAGIPVLIVTGRSAGWVSGLVSYLPVAGAIAENGGLFYPAQFDPAPPTPSPDPGVGELRSSPPLLGGERGPVSEGAHKTIESAVALTPIPDIAGHRQQLARAFEYIKAKFPQIQESADNRFRITDWTFDNRDLTLAQLQSMGALCQQLGWGFTYSSVQCHIKPALQDKAAALLKVLHDCFPQYTPEQVITVGDSPNDESLFDARYFPVSVGVANVLDYAERLRYKPAYVTTAAEGKGFCELAQLLLKSTSHHSTN